MVDDDPEIRELLAVNLVASGHEVMQAEDGPAAIAAATEERPDLIMLDVMMPSMDGFEVLEALKEVDPDVAAIPVVMVTGRTAPEDRFRGGVEGALVYVTKPFDPTKVVEIIERLLGDPRPEREQRSAVQKDALASMARYERTGSLGEVGVADDGRVRLTRLEHEDSSAPDYSVPRFSVESLSPRQRELVVALAAGASVAEAAAQLAVSRSNVYATLQRLARNAGVGTSEAVLGLIRAGAFR